MESMQHTRVKTKCAKHMSVRHIGVRHMGVRHTGVRHTGVKHILCCRELPTRCLARVLQAARRRLQVLSFFFALCKPLSLLLCEHFRLGLQTAVIVVCV